MTDDKGKRKKSKKKMKINERTYDSLIEKRRGSTTTHLKKKSRPSSGKMYQYSKIRKKVHKKTHIRKGAPEDPHQDK